MNNKGNVVIMMGELATQAAIVRTEGSEKVFKQHPDIRLSRSRQPTGGEMKPSTS